MYDFDKFVYDVGLIVISAIFCIAAVWAQIGLIMLIAKLLNFKEELQWFRERRAIRKRIQLEKESPKPQIKYTIENSEFIREVMGIKTPLTNSQEKHTHE